MASLDTCAKFLSAENTATDRLLGGSEEGADSQHANPSSGVILFTISNNLFCPTLLFARLLVTSVAGEPQTVIITLSVLLPVPTFDCLREEGEEEAGRRLPSWALFPRETFLVLVAQRTGLLGKTELTLVEKIPKIEPEFLGRIFPLTWETYSFVTPSCDVFEAT
ncbi:hypothetical protein CHUAL_005853 [Chamberlinius hualienensis]